MTETLPKTLTIDGIDYEVRCWFNYMGKASCGIAPVGALDVEILPATTNPNGSKVPALLVRQVPARAKSVYVATFSVDFDAQTVSSENADKTLLDAFVAGVFASTEETLTVTDSATQKAAQVSSPSLGEMVLTARKDYIATVSVAAKTDDGKRLCWSCGGRFTYAEVMAAGGDWNVSGGCECGC